VHVLTAQHAKANPQRHTLVGRAQTLAEAVRMGRTAQQLIDLREHNGEHPRMGATDVVPSSRSGRDDGGLRRARTPCGNAWRGARHPVFLYEAAATRPERGEPRRRARRAEGLRDRIGRTTRAPDFGPPHIHPRPAPPAVGARKFLIAYNVNLASPDVKLAKRIAKSIREKDGGFKCVKAMGFHLADRDLAQVSMNMTDYETTPLLTVYEAIERLAGEAGVQTLESELVGLAPAAALPGDVARRIKLRDFDPEKQVIERRAACDEVGPRSAGALLTALLGSGRRSSPRRPRRR
jgi:glutamate formiminotransferase